MLSAIVAKMFHIFQGIWIKHGSSNWSVF